MYQSKSVVKGLTQTANSILFGTVADSMTMLGCCICYVFIAKLNDCWGDITYISIRISGEGPHPVSKLHLVWNSG